MELTIALSVLAVVCLILGLWSTKAYSRLPKHAKYVPPAMPSVAFPFEPLTDVVEECAKKFSAAPLKPIPEAKIAPAHYFAKGTDAFYLQSSGTIYVKDAYANAASVEQLLDTILLALVHVWIHQNLSINMTVPDDPVYLTTYAAVRKLMGIDADVELTAGA